MQGAPAGLQVLVTLPPGLDEHAVAAAARKNGIGVYPLGDFRTGSPSTEHGLLLGFGALGQPSIGTGIEQLGAVIAAQMTEA